MTGCTADETRSAGDPTRFAGKARDAETFLDYFEARYYNNLTGRFASVDPGHIGGNIEDPQSWNGYAYARNNPLRYVDPNGQFSTAVHNEIIDRAFPGLTEIQRAILKAVSKDADSLRGQMPRNAYKHGMSQRSDPGADIANFESFVQSQSAEARRAGLNSAQGLVAAGLALHALTDSLSPTHIEFQRWSWFEVVTFPVHSYFENLLTTEAVKEQAIQEARLWYGREFGLDALKAALGNPSLFNFGRPLVPSVTVTCTGCGKE